MRIALVAPLSESVPPLRYGGAQRVIFYLAESLVDLGHEVTLYATGDSLSRATLRTCAPKGLRLDETAVDHLSTHLQQIELVVREAAKHDVVHFHTEALSFPVLRRISTPHLCTFHGRLDLPEMKQLFHEFQDGNFVSASHSQRHPIQSNRWLGTVYHGTPAKHFGYNERSEGYLAFLGRICPDKGPENAIEIAKRSGKKIKIAGKIAPGDRFYFDSIRKHFEDPCVEYVGEITDAEKAAFLGNAEALLFPINWPEPFGLVMTEALATGTPVIAYPYGSVPEIIRTGQNGFIVRSITEAVAAIKSVPLLSRAQCRRDFENRFTSERMARDYVHLYQSVIDQKKSGLRVPLGQLAGLRENNRLEMRH